MYKGLSLAYMRTLDAILSVLSQAKGTKSLKLLTSIMHIFEVGSGMELFSRTYGQAGCIHIPSLCSLSIIIKVNDLSYHLFYAKKGEIENHQLLPCRNCLVNHALRASYQAEKLRRCLKQDPCSWSMED